GAERGAADCIAEAEVTAVDAGAAVDVRQPGRLLGRAATDALGNALAIGPADGGGRDSGAQTEDRQRHESSLTTTRRTFPLARAPTVNSDGKRRSSGSIVRTAAGRIAQWAMRREARSRPAKARRHAAA